MREDFFKNFTDDEKRDMIKFVKNYKLEQADDVIDLLLDLDMIIGLSLYVSNEKEV